MVVGIAVAPLVYVGAVLWFASHSKAAVRPAGASTDAAPFDALPEEVEQFFEAPWRTFRDDRVPRGFWIVTLSNLAEYCRNAEATGLVTTRRARRCVRELARLGQHRRLSPYGARWPADLGDHGLYLTHLNIILGIERAVTGDDTPARRHAEISRTLARRSLEDPLAHVPSFPGSRARYPADQAATLYSLALYDRVSGTTLSRRPIERWLAVMRENVHPELGLPVSEVARTKRWSGTPRGCALSWMVRYMADFAPEEALALWKRYRERYFVSVGVAAGFREWPPGVNGPSDDDSGPIVMGIGAAATGLALGAARAVGDKVTYYQLKSSQLLVTTGGGEALARAGASILALAIALNGDTQPRLVR